MDLTVIGLSLLGVASFFGLWTILGKLIGKYIAIRKKSKIDALTEAIKDPTLRQAAIDSMKKADEYFTSEQGKSKMDWVANQVSLLIPGPVDDFAIHQVLEGVYQGYKEELAALNQS